MMRRLEAERRRAGTAALRAQEEERARIARDLHDEVNQSLTGLLLRLEAVARGGAAGARARRSRRPRRWPTRRCGSSSPWPASCARRRSTTSAWPPRSRGQVEQVSRSGVDAELVEEGDFSDLDSDVQLVVYRVAQEALSNAARHSGPERISVRLRRDGEGVELDVSDDGRGFAFDDSERGLGIAGMRERALLRGGDLTIESRPGQGTTVRLRGMRVLIADDHGIVRSGIRLLLERQADIEVIAEAADGAEARSSSPCASAPTSRSSTSRCRS